MNENILEKARKDYIHSGGRLGGGNWEDIAGRLPSQSLPLRAVATRISVILAIPLLFLSGVVGISQAAKPGEFLYPVKVTSNNFVSKLTKEIKFKIEKQSQKTLGTEDKNLNVEKAKTEENGKELEDEEKSIPKGQENKETIINIPQGLDNKFEKTQEENGKAKGLEKAQEQTSQVKKEPEKGKSEENKGSGKNIRQL